MWLDELAVFAMMGCALTWALLNREERRVVTPARSRRSAAAEKHQSGLLENSKHRR